MNWDKYGEERLLSRHRLLREDHRLLTKYFLDYFSEIDTSAKILDVGCGDGFFLELLRGLGFNNLSGIDLSVPMARRAQEKGLCVLKANIYDLMDEEDYDLILLMDLLEHLDRPHAGLEKVHRALKTGGVLFMNIPVCDSIQKRARRWIGIESREKQMRDWDETHVQSYSKGEWVDLIGKIGFEVSRTTRLSNPYPLLGRISRGLSHFLQQFTLWGMFGDFLTIEAKK